MTHPAPYRAPSLAGVGRDVTGGRLINQAGFGASVGSQRYCKPACAFTPRRLCPALSFPLNDRKSLFIPEGPVIAQSICDAIFFRSAHFVDRPQFGLFQPELRRTHARFQNGCGRLWRGAGVAHGSGNQRGLMGHAYLR
jgi:hypothetical protein